ncbi:MAG TPA: Maf family protein [Candidatus Babeliales bacterium]|nr:Maf family protein [Candidatus Babeliales bacterium]
MNTLFLASKSRSRRELLDFCRIPYQLVALDADESQHPALGLLELVQYLAELKMQHVRLPAPGVALTPESRCWVLTADTLGMNAAGELCRKPVDRADAIRMIRSYRQGAVTATGFCVERRCWQPTAQVWQLEQRLVRVASAKYCFNVPEHRLDEYLDLGFSGISYLAVSGAVEIERFGIQYLEGLEGSYTAIVGLPMYEVRLALEQLGFYVAPVLD